MVTNPKQETLTITLHEVFSDVSQELGVDPGLQKDGVEAHLQELLAANPHAIEVGLTLVRREYPTAIGPIDLVCRDGSDTVVAIEVKRRGDIDGVEQLARYIERLHLDSSLGDSPRRVRGPGRQTAGPASSPRPAGSAGSRSTTTNSAACAATDLRLFCSCRGQHSRFDQRRSGAGGAARRSPGR